MSQTISESLSKITFGPFVEFTGWMPLSQPTGIIRLRRDAIVGAKEFADHTELLVAGGHSVTVKERWESEPSSPDSSP